ncbi:MAG: phage terminase large subunit [Campylobacteraceae bacterium]|jgi:predicted phage terminase large subunit-like protein|nr:phage terminase large subunit [Campylobacteraceae bacterium]
MSLPKVINPNIKYRLSPIQQLKVAKHIMPSVFEHPTPAFHLDILNFINGDEQYKAAAIFRGAGKTTLLNKVNIFCRVFFEFEPFTLLCSANREKAENFLSDIKNMIIEAGRKGYAIEPGKEWTKEKIDIIVNKGKKDETGRCLEKTCYIVSISVGTSPRGYVKNGIRPTLIVCDDMESTVGQFAVGSASNRKKIERFFYADLLPTLHPIRGQVYILGTIVHVASLLNNIINPDIPNEDTDEPVGRTHQNDWDIKVYPILKDGKPTWASRFSLDYIENMKNMFSSRGLENEFYQEYMCKPFSPERQVFKREDFNYFDGLEYKDIVPSITMRDAINIKNVQCPQPTHIIVGDKKIELSSCRIYTTMDLASYDGADRTAIVTFAQAQDNNIYILDISCGHWTPFEKSVNAIRIQTSFNPISFGIEKASAQNDFFYTIQAAQKETGIKINITPLSHHSKNKNLRIMQLHPLFITGKIFFNKRQSATIELEAELLEFDPEVESKHDDLMDALAYMVEFIGSHDMMEDWEEIEEYEPIERDELF